MADYYFTDNNKRFISEAIMRYPCDQDGHLGEIRCFTGWFHDDNGDLTQTLELKADPDNLPISPRGTPVRNTGTVHVEVSCTSLDDGKVVEFSLLRGKLYPCKRPTGPSPRLSRSSHDSESHGHSDRSSHGSHDGHHGDHGGHGHGHGGGHVNTLRNIKRWLAQSEVEIDHSFAMYEIMLSGMKSNI